MLAATLVLALAIPPASAQHVTDAAHVMTQTAVETLNQKLDSYHKQTDHQVIAYIARSSRPPGKLIRRLR